MLVKIRLILFSNLTVCTDTLPYCSNSPVCTDALSYCSNSTAEADLVIFFYLEEKIASFLAEIFGRCCNISQKLTFLDLISLFHLDVFHLTVGDLIIASDICRNHCAGDVILADLRHGSCR